MPATPEHEEASRSARGAGEATAAEERDAFLREVLASLRATPRQIPCKYLYDRRGSELFEQICELEEYYPTRTEIGILERHGGDLASRLGPHCQVIEPGSGAGVKTRILLRHLHQPAGFIPIEISCDHLFASVAELEKDFPELEVLPVCGDFTGEVVLPEPRSSVRRRVVFFPGSTIGNFEPHEVPGFLGRCRDLVGARGALVIGVDLKKDPAVLLRAYDDAAGITARFILNVLARINRELGADFDLEAFDYRARYDVDRGRVEMEIVSRRAQRVRIGGETLSFAADEPILAELSHKYGVEEFQALARGSGLEAEASWTDPHELFSLHLLTVPGCS